MEAQSSIPNERELEQLWTSVKGTKERRKSTRTWLFVAWNLTEIFVRIYSLVFKFTISPLYEPIVLKLSKRGPGSLVSVSGSSCVPRQCRHEISVWLARSSLAIFIYVESLVNLCPSPLCNQTYQYRETEGEQGRSCGRQHIQQG